MAHVDTSLTWSLGSAASTTIAVFKDVMRAATSDNVQPLALISCEKFGATLAMCPETNKKMEDLIIKVSGPKYLRFMSAQIGYSANDSATQLSRSLAGVQFLGLAAALVSSVDMFEGANALSVMLIDSATDKTLLPTARHLKDLLAVMEHRVNRSGFTDIWVGYQILLLGGLRASSERGHGRRRRDSTELMETPGIDGISKLVEAFRQLNRLGDATAITIRTTSCAPWVMAFTRWCLAVPPSTILPNGKVLLDQPASQVTLFTENDAKACAFEIAVQRSIDSPADLLISEVTERLAARSHPGMVTIECLGRMTCREMGGEGSLAYRAMCEALPYALKQTCELLQPMIQTKEFNKAGTVEAEQRAPETERLATFDSKHHIQPFPKDFIISNLLTRILNSESQRNIQRLDDGQLISDLPLVHLHLRNLAKNCRCKHCQGRPIPPYRTEESDVMCWSGEEFLSDISSYSANILALSIFEGPETLLVSLNHGYYDDDYAQSAFPQAIREILKYGKPAVCESDNILLRALTLIGHTDLDMGRWVISCYKGQAVHPRVFETRSICQPGYLILSWAPGLLFFDGEVYNRGIDPKTGFSFRNSVAADRVSMLLSRPVIEPLNVLPNMRLEWKVIRRDGYLEVYPTCGEFVGQASEILGNLSRALILRGCPHDRASPLDRPDLSSIYMGPFLPSPEQRSSGAERRIGVIAVDGDAGLRMFAVSVLDAIRSECPFVIRGSACLQCCLDLCRKTSSDLLIC